MADSGCRGCFPRHEKMRKRTVTKEVSGERAHNQAQTFKLDAPALIATPPDGAIIEQMADSMAAAAAMGGILVELACGP